jgi:hypothetical protein
MGYACDCTMPLSRQMALVAEFYVHRIRPSRIAYRLGIDIARVEGWLSGEQDGEQFLRLVAAFKKKKYQTQMRRADRFRGQQAYEMRLAAHNDLRVDQGTL